MGIDGTWIKTEWRAILGAAVVTIFGIFPQTLADRLKTGLNIANQRTAQYKEIATVYSTFTYGVDGIYQMYDEGINLRRINIGFAKDIVKSYNDALTQLMNNQYVYKDEIKKLWGTTFFVIHTDVPHKYESLFRYVDSVVDPAVHSMNWMGVKLQPLRADSNYTFLPDESKLLRKELDSLKVKIDLLHQLTEQTIQGME
jgi:hypothetical protein